MALEVINASLVLGLMNLTLVNVTLAAITLGDFVVLHNVTPPGLPAPVTYGIYTEGPVTVVNGIYIYANSTLYFDRPVNATPCNPIKLGKFYVLTPQGVVVVGQVGNSCRYLAFISHDGIEVYGIPLRGASGAVPKRLLLVAVFSAYAVVTTCISIPIPKIVYKNNRMIGAISTRHAIFKIKTNI